MSSERIELGTKLGPILWQLGASWRFDAGRVERFLGVERLAYLSAR